MQYYQCKCGKSAAWNTGERIYDCEGCDECQTTYAQSPNGHKPLQPHKFDKILYNQNTGKPYKLCSDCYKTDDESYQNAKIKDK